MTGRRLVLGNGDVRISYAVAGAPSPWYRNGIGDECVYVERGAARVETVFGAFDVAEGDYLVIPRATTHRWIPKRSTKEPLRAYCIEANSPHRAAEALPEQVRPAARARAVLRARPARCRPGRCWPRTWAPRRATRPRSTSSTAATDPAASSARCTRCRSTRSTSWAGTGASTPTRSTSRDFEPITGRVHQPPPVHQVFEGWNFVICNFVPRKVDYHPLSIPVPYYHSNVDSDEIMFYVDGDYEARKGSGIGKGSISVHPGGHAHGPQPGASEALDRRGVLRRAGCHGRHLPPARARRGRPGGRRRQVRVVVEPGSGCTGRSADGSADAVGLQHRVSRAVA